MTQRVGGTVPLRQLSAKNQNPSAIMGGQRCSTLRPASAGLMSRALIRFAGRYTRRAKGLDTATGSPGMETGSLRASPWRGTASLCQCLYRRIHKGVQGSEVVGLAYSTPHAHPAWALHQEGSACDPHGNGEILGKSLILGADALRLAAIAALV